MYNNNRKGETEIKIKATTKDAYKLVHDGILALARAERQGIKLDVEYCERKRKHLERKIEFYQKKIEDTKFYRRWNHIYGAKANIYSNHQLSRILYKVLKIEPPKTTESGMGATDEYALSQINIPELKLILQIRKLAKIKETYLGSFIREYNDDGCIHPFFNLHTVRTHRSCIAKGTKILVVKDFIKYPNGIPIEEVKVGDYVYCFDNDLNPAIRKVLWAGKTGCKEVIRLHWGTRGKKGYLDVTPEHLIKLIDGTYKPAKDLDPKMFDYRKKDDSRHVPKVRVLSCFRNGDRIKFTGHSRHGTGLPEHQVIYEHFYKDKVKRGEVIHHKNEIHLDHSPENLQKMTLKKHSSWHGKNAPPELVEKRIQVLHKNRHKIQPKYGWDNPVSLRLSKIGCLRELAKNKGLVSKTQYDFDTFKKYLELYSIDPWQVKLRYDKNGKYISKWRLKKLAKQGRSIISKKLGHNYYKLLELYQLYGIDTKRKWGNQYGKFVPGNHVITNVEWIHKKVDVYDLEVEEYNNFFANEICVHNSSDRPNFQNIPIRDNESMKICRRAILPRPGHMLVESDFSALEVNISQLYHNDPVMGKYLSDKDSDMHLDMAKQIFMLEEMDRSLPAHKALRTAAKSGFVFPQFYGDYYGNNAKSLADWVGLPREGKWKRNSGIKLPDGTHISDHFRSKGITSFNSFTDHMQEVENDFWNNRFRKYHEWRKSQVAKYRKKGYLEMLTGFRCSGVMRRNEIMNYPIQGTAFHCLLFTFIRLDEVMREENWNTRLVGQIHDSIIMDVDPNELDHVQETAHRIVREDLPAKWDWITIPLEIEIDIYGVDKPWVK